MGKRLGLIGVALCFTFPAFAQPVSGPSPSEASPRLSFCIGKSTTCVVPDFGLQTISYDLKAKAWGAGVTTLGAGYALLFASDTPYAAGVAVHASFNFDQKTTNYFAPTIALVGFHWFEVGYTPVFMDGQIGQRLTLGANINAEAVTAWLTKQNLEVRRQALERARQ